MDTAPVQRIVARQESLRRRLKARRLEALVTSDLKNIYYLTGFRGSAGLAAFAPSEGTLWVDPRYTAQAHEQARGAEVLEEKGSLLRAAGRWLRRNKFKRVGYDDLHLTCAQLRALEREASGAVRLVPAGGLVEELRLVKDADEIEAIRGAGQLTVEVLEEVLPKIHPGVREADLAAEMEYRMRLKGAEGPAFETIVASGPRSAWPHARASSKQLAAGELVILDLGAILAGYAADMTRTFFLGRPNHRIRALYAAVRDAQQRAVEAIRPGQRAAQVDLAARRSLARRGLDRYFTHSVGHGVGLDVHERPRLGRNEKKRLVPGCVVTAEPAVYLDGVGGIRIEDTVLVGADGPTILTPATKDHWCIV